MYVCAWVCVWMHFSICGAGHESKLHENINTVDQKICTELFSSRGFKGVFGALLCMWEMVGTAVMRRGKVREIKRVPFKKKSPVQSYKLNDLQALAFSLSSEY